MRIQYQEVRVFEVMNFFAKAFEPKDGEVQNFDWFYDPHKGTVIFKLYVAEVSSHGETERKGT